MVWVKSALVLLELLLLFVSTGYLVGRVVEKEKNSIIKCISDGFVWVLAIFGIIALPFMWLQLPFRYLFILFCILAVVTCVVGGGMLIREKRLYFSFSNDLFLIMTVVFIITQMLCSTYLYHTDDDDGCYISTANMAVYEDVIENDWNIVYNGEYKEELADSFGPPIVSWELFIACVAKLNGLPPAILAHSILPLWLIALAYMTIYRIGLTIFDENKQPRNSTRLLFMYAVLNLFGGFLVRQPACFLLLRIWQGKAVLVSIIFPLVIENCLQIYKGKRKGSWIRAVALLMAGTMLSLVGLTLTPICYVVYGCPYIVYILFRERSKLKEVLTGAILSIIPAVLFCAVSLWYVMSRESGRSFVESTPERWIVWLQVTMGSTENGYLLLGIIAMVIILIKGHKESKRCLIGGTAMTFATVLNPLLSDFVGQKIIGVSVYWRVWWIVPLYLIIALAFVYVLNMTSKVLIHALITIVLVVCVASNGTFMYQRGLYFEEYKNPYKLPGELLSVCDFILERDQEVTILVPQDMMRKVRQYSTKLYVPLAKYMIDSDIMVPGTDYTYGEAYRAVYENKQVIPEVKDALKVLEVKYLVTEDSIEGVELIGSVDGMHIWEVK